MLNLQKSILVLLITLQVVLCRPDISLTSGSNINGYDYPKPKVAFEEVTKKSVVETPPPTYLPPVTK